MFCKIVLVTFYVLFPASISYAEIGSECTTPNGEKALCTAISSCQVIAKEVMMKNKSAIEFAKKSNCGFARSEPLICCGSTAFKIVSGSACTTPNGEKALCKPISSCEVIAREVLKGNTNAKEFAKLSNCGYDREPLVCCGSTAFKTVLEEAISCITPNKEPATCIPLNSCKTILDATANHRDAIEFANFSRCSNSEKDLVCCGTEGNFYQGSPLLPKRTECGIQKPLEKIIGGTLTELGEYPWMVLLRYKSLNGSDAGFKCGGTLINNRYILTAAHCVSNSTTREFVVDSVRLGEWNVSTANDCEQGLINQECADPVVDLQIEQKIVHPEYNQISKKNDIALLRLERNVLFTDYIKAICLPHPKSAAVIPSTELFISGWGATENSSNSDIKLKAKVPIVSTSECMAKVRNIRQITDKQVCAGGKSNKDSCQGDSGGPLMGLFEHDVTDRDQWYQEGIVSWGSGCGIVGIPAVYTRVAMYMEWIIDNLKSF